MESVDFENLDITKVDKRTKLYKDYLEWQSKKNSEPAVEETPVEEVKEETIPEPTQEPEIIAEEEVPEVIEETSVTEEIVEEEVVPEITPVIVSELENTAENYAVELKFLPGHEVWIAEWCNERENKGFTSIVDSYKYRPRKKTIIEVIISVEKILYKMNDKTKFESSYVFHTYEEAERACNLKN